MREYCDEHKQTRSDMIRVEHRIDIVDIINKKEILRKEVFPWVGAMYF